MLSVVDESDKTSYWTSLKGYGSFSARKVACNSSIVAVSSLIISAFAGPSIGGTSSDYITFPCVYQTFSYTRSITCEGSMPTTEYVADKLPFLGTFNPGFSMCFQGSVYGGILQALSMFSHR